MRLVAEKYARTTATIKCIEVPTHSKATAHGTLDDATTVSVSIVSVGVRRRAVCQLTTWRLVL